MILADSSIWVDHFRRANPQLQRLLDAEEITMHPYIVMELALGSLKDRASTLADLDLIDRIEVAETAEVRGMIEARSLYSRGIGFVDAHLIASCLLTPGTELWTRDDRLKNAARMAGVRTLAG